MPWKESDAMSLKLKFAGRYLDGERMSDLCREFGISRKTGYKILERFKEQGCSAFHSQSSRPHRSPNKTADGIVKLIVSVRQTYPSWGAPKIRNYLIRKHPEIELPVTSTIHVILDRHNLVRRRSNRRRFKAKGTALYAPSAPNDLWCADFKGQFRLQDKSYCYPLTMTDQFSRFLLCVDALESTKEDSAFFVFERIFREYGLPLAIRTDNGVPFSSRSIYGLSKLSAWWLRLGIKLERIEPGHPQQNGAHERMHLTLKQATTMPPAVNILQQQEVFDSFIQVFNEERPHDGINKMVPSELYQKSERIYPNVLPEPDYSICERNCRISKCGSIFFDKQRVFISEALGNQPVGLRQIDDELWEILFMKYKLGYFDEEGLKFTPNTELISIDDEDEMDLELNV